MAASPPLPEPPIDPPPAGVPPVAGPPVSGVRLNIAILLLWTACTAFVLAAFQPTLTGALAHDKIEREALANMEPDRALSHRGPNGHMVLMQIAAVTLAALCGAAIASLPLGMWKCTSRGPRFPTLPGHWLLICSGGVTLAVVVQIWLNGIDQERIDRFHLSGPVALGWIAAVLLCPALFLAAMANVKASTAWRAVFHVPFWSALGIPLLGMVLSPLMDYLPFVLLHILLLPLLLAALWITLLLRIVVEELQSSVKLDWLHWTGIVVVLAQIVLFAGISLLGLNPFLL